MSQTRQTRIAVLKRRAKYYFAQADKFAARDMWPMVKACEEAGNRAMRMAQELEAEEKA